MLSQTLSHTDLLSLPVVALALFMGIFAIVVFRVWRRGADSPVDAYAAGLPLQDDDIPPGPTLRHEGGHHG